ncbi:phosphatase PAP2 family protein [Roseibium sediminis]|uniref:phosphatase PAP2 family protein n=1 Tax=Roseibium sediminis TaxID=1775174 RepID=UPI00123D7A39|nr:phosphatase PAP2 family protein [Roseibium sediminis]
MFTQTERLLFLVVTAILIVDLVVIVTSGQKVNWTGYVVGATASALMIGLGLFYRLVRGNERIAVTCLAAAIYILFSIGASVLNYLLLPVGDRATDLELVQIDSMLGFNWPDYVRWFIGYPWLAQVFGLVYASAISQIALVIFCLGISVQKTELYRFLCCGLIGVLASMAIWYVAPSFGTSVVYDIDALGLTSFTLVVGADYGEALRQQAQFGIEVLSPDNVLGLIAFPSVHILLAGMCTVYSRTLKRIFPVLLVLNMAVIPATILHGGHHLIDILAGVALFAISYFVARILVRDPHPENSGALVY